MPDAGSFLATPEKRVAAALIDIVIVMLAALVMHLIACELGFKSNFASFIAVTYFFYHAGFLHGWRGQSPGRRTMDICAVSDGGGHLGIPQIVVRSALRPVCCMIPARGFLEVELLHVDPYATAIVVIVEVVLLAYTPTRRTGVDRIARVIVVNTPPPQPHRAPAVPMYSAGDAEFGYPPRKRPEDK